jgi:FkbM family methyltransferase
LISTSRNDSAWHAINLALGKERTTSQINVSDNDGLSSSILPMGDLHKGAFPKSGYKHSEEIQVSTINDEILRLGIDPSTTLLKMDVQGYEKNVILGGLDQLGKFPLCFLEASLSPLYDGEASLLELLNLLDSLSHHLTDIFRGAQDQRGHLLQVDILTSLIRK